MATDTALFAPPADAAPTPTRRPAAPTPADVAAGVAGLAAAGLCTTLALLAATQTAPTPTAALVGLVMWPSAWLRAAAIVGPSLVVAAAVFGLRLRAADVATALAAGVTRSGRVAGGVAPVTLFFALTSSQGPAIGLAAALWAGREGLREVAHHLHDDDPTTWLLVSTWRVVLLAVGARLLVSSLADLWAVAASGA